MGVIYRIKTEKELFFMYEYDYVSVTTPLVNNYFNECQKAIETYAKNGWRFVAVLKPLGVQADSQLVFERLAPRQQ